MALTTFRALTGETTSRVKASQPAQTLPHMAHSPYQLEPKKTSTNQAHYNTCVPSAYAGHRRCTTRDLAG